MHRSLAAVLVIAAFVLLSDAGTAARADRKAAREFHRTRVRELPAELLTVARDEPLRLQDQEALRPVPALVRGEVGRAKGGVLHARGRFRVRCQRL